MLSSLTPEAGDDAPSTGPAKYADVAVERWHSEAGRAAVLDGDGRSFEEVKEERLGSATATEAA